MQTMFHPNQSAFSNNKIRNSNEKQKQKDKPIEDNNN